MKAPKVGLAVIAAVTLALTSCSSGTPAASSGGSTGGSGGGSAENAAMMCCVYPHGDGGGFWSVAKKGAEKAAKDLGVTLDYQESNNDAQKQAQLIEAGVSGGCKALAVSAPAPDAIKDALKKATAAGGASTAARPPAPEKERDSQGTGAVRPAPAAGTTSLSKMRQAIARRMSQSKATAPHYYLTLDIDMTAALEFRSQINANATEEQRVSINDLIVKACAIALERQPQFNAEFHESGLEMHERVNICIGVALDDGLIAPAILDCQSKSLGRIAVEAKDLIGRAKRDHWRLVGGKIEA